MLNKLNSLREREEGFTLIELLIVVIIIGILAAIALPIFIDQQKVAVDASVQSDLRNTVTNITNAQAQNDLTNTKAAVSREGTELTLTSDAVGATAAAITSKATKSAAIFADIPALGRAYKLAGVNEGGKKYKSDAFTFDSSTGLFGLGTAAGSNPVTPANPYNATTNTYTVSATTFNANFVRTISSESYGYYTFQLRSKVYVTDSSVGINNPPTIVATSDWKMFNGITPGGTSRGIADANIKYYNGDGTLISGTGSAGAQYLGYELDRDSEGWYIRVRFDPNNVTFPDISGSGTDGNGVQAYTNWKNSNGYVVMTDNGSTYRFNSIAS